MQLGEVREPLARATMRRCVGFLVGFVHPVRGDTGFSDAVHLPGAYLHLERQALRSEQRRVQGLITVDARDGDVVLEAARHRLVKLVHEAEHLVTAVDVVDNDSETVHVNNLGK